MSRHRRKKHLPPSDSTPSAAHCVPAVPPAAAAETGAPATTRGAGLKTHALLAALILCLCAGLYSWTADFPMVFDDHTYMMDNPLFQDKESFKYLANFQEFATRPARMGTDPDYAVNFILRPVAYASFHLNFLMDGFTPRWFRVVNIVIHTLNALLIYSLVTLLLRRARTVADSSVLFIASASALLFAAHPLAIESVTYIVQRFTSMAAFFSLLSLCLYFASLGVGGRAWRWTLRGLAVLAVLLAMQTKEDAFMVPFLAVLLDWLVVGTQPRHALKRALPLLLCAPLIPLLVFLTAAAQNGGLTWEHSINIVNSRDNPLDHWHYILTQFTVVAHYLRLMVWPTGLNLDPEWPVHTTLWSAPVLGGLAVVLSVLGLSWWLHRRNRGDARFAAGFAFTLWFFLVVSVSSGIVPLPDMMAEHRSYMPSIGIFILMACVLDRLRQMEPSRWRLAPRRLVPAACLLAVAALSWATCARNEVWRSNESLWKDTVAKSPGKFRTWGNLGTAYSLRGKENQAVDCYRKALQIEPRFQNGLLNLSNSLLRLNQPKESLETTLELIKLDKTAATKPPVAFTLGLGFAGVGRYDDAVKVFREILAIMPNDPQVHKALGLVYEQTGLHHRALDHYEQALALNPADSQAGQLVENTRQTMAAKRQMRQMRLVQPGPVF